jgi:hypothetical protein
MLPLIPLALSVVPELIKAIAGDRAGAVAGRVADVVHAVTGTADAAEAQRLLVADPALATTLRVRLAEIALESEKTQLLAAEQRRQAELAQLRTALEDTQGARTALSGLVAAGSSIAWGAPVVSVIVTGGFFVFLLALMWGGIDAGRDQTVANIVNIAVGALATAFATVVNFWLGSSQGSRSKDAAVARVQEVAMGWSRPAPERPAPPPPAPPAGDALFERCLAVVLDKEGGFSDRPDDRGGPANMGVAWRGLAEWRGLPAGELSPEGLEHLVGELRALTRREAAEIHRATVWLPMRCADLPPPLALMAFDFGVTAGARIAAKALQRVVGVTDDGSMGPLTLSAIAAQPAERLLDGLAEARVAQEGAASAARTQQVLALARAMRE